MKRPGFVARDYVSGKQRPYVNPLGYFFLAAALQIVAIYVSKPSFHAQVRGSLQRSFEQQDPESLAQINEFFGGDASTAVAEIYFSAIQQAYAYAALLCFCFPFALLLMGLHRLLGEDFRLGETMVFALYSFGQTLVITACLTPIAMRINTTCQFVMGMVTYFLFPMHAHSGFFKSTWRSRAMTVLSTFISTCLFMTSIVIIFVVSIVVWVVTR